MPLSQHIIDFIDNLAHQYDVSSDRLVLKAIFYAIEPKSPEEKVKEIQQEAVSKGWTYEQLWNKHPSPDLKGLIEFIDDYIEIAEVAKKHISLLHLDSGTINKIYNMQTEQPGITKIKKEIPPSLNEVMPEGLNVVDQILWKFERGYYST